MKTFLNFALLLLISTILQIVQAIKIDNLSFRDKQDYRGLNGKQQFSFSQADPSCVRWEKPPAFIFVLTSPLGQNGQNLLTYFKTNIISLIEFMSPATVDRDNTNIPVDIIALNSDRSTASNSYFLTTLSPQGGTIGTFKRNISHLSFTNKLNDLNKLTKIAYNKAQTYNSKHVYIVFFVASDFTPKVDLNEIISIKSLMEASLITNDSKMTFLIHLITDLGLRLLSHTKSLFNVITSCSKVEGCNKITTGVSTNLANSGIFTTIKSQTCLDNIKTSTTTTTTKVTTMSTTTTTTEATSTSTPTTTTEATSTSTPTTKTEATSTSTQTTKTTSTPTTTTELSTTKPTPPPKIRTPDASTNLQKFKPKKAKKSKEDEASFAPIMSTSAGAFTSLLVAFLAIFSLI